MFRIDDHIGIAIAGLTSDARVLRYVDVLLMSSNSYQQLMMFSNYMRQQAMGERMVFNRPIPVNRIVSSIADSEWTSYPSRP